MAINHILMYHFKEGVSDTRIDEHLDFIKGFQGTPGLLKLECGRNICPWHTQYTHGFVMTFDTQESLDAYNASERHKELVQTFGPDLSEKAGFDMPV